MRTCVKKTSPCLFINAPVHFNEAPCIEPLCEFSETLHFPEAPLNKGLAPITRIDRHDQYQVQVGQDLFQEVNRSVWIQGDSGFHPFLFDVGHGAVEVGTRFPVDGEYRGSGTGKGEDIAAGIDDHQVYVKGFGGDAGHMFHHGKPEGDVGHKDTIHDITVDPVGLTLVDHFHFGGQMVEIGRQQRRSYHSLHPYKVKRLFGFPAPCPFPQPAPPVRGGHCPR